ncbi:MAG: acyltransferase family protein [Janthinobacterium lividum]
MATKDQDQLVAGQRPGKEQVVGLDVLRFAAALLVMFYHLGSMSWRVSGNPAARIIDAPLSLPRMLPLTSFGWVGVELFFVISGFVILYSSEGQSAAAFAKLRALRLLPCIWFSALACACVAVIFSHEPVYWTLARLLMTLAVYPVPFWIDNVYWTLNVEISFYLLVYVLIRQGNPARLEIVVTALGCFSSVLWLLADTGLVPHLAYYLNKHVSRVLLFTQGGYFALGVIAFRVMRDGATMRRIAAAALCLVGALCEIRAGSTIDSVFLGVEDNPIIPQSVFLVGMAIFATSLLLRAPLGAWLSGWRRPIRLLGLSTYPLYLLHTTFGGLALHVALRVGLSDEAALAAAILFNLGLALFVASRVEPLLRGRLRMWLDRLPLDSRMGGPVTANPVPARR